jgi:hypothetical protein
VVEWDYDNNFLCFHEGKSGGNRGCADPVWVMFIFFMVERCYMSSEILCPSFLLFLAIFSFN